MKNKVALVTGANRGLGLEVCRQLSKMDTQVILTSRNTHLGEAAVQRLKSNGLPVQYCPLDVTDQKSVDFAFSWVQAKFGKLDILVNNAGILKDRSRHPADMDTDSFFNTSIESIQNSIETNTYGTIRMIQKFIPLMRRDNFGRIVNLSSGMGQLSEMNGGWPGYRISKCAINAVTRIVADELKGSNILINSVCPGWVKTDMGGPQAELSVEEGADTIVWLATLPEGGPSGGFYRKRMKIEW